jgi:hypothetical protein
MEVILLDYNNNNDMKKTIKIFAMAAMVLTLAACEKHDFFDENTITGAVGPEAYWEIESSAVKAGGAMGFTAQYYSSKEQIDHSEAWYSISETLDKTVNCSWLSHSEISSVKSKKRELQYISQYPHLEEYWSDSLHAYTFTDAFPVSGTLAPLSWVQPAEFDSAKMVAYFGETYMQDFKDAVKKKMTYAIYKTQFTKLGFMEDFKLYTDSSYNWNVSPDSSVAKYYHFPLDADGNVQPWVMDSMNYYWDKVSFEQLILNTEGKYDVTYKRNYSLDAELRVYDARGTYSKTISKEIVIN